MFPDLTLQQIGMRLAAMVIVAAVHGAAVAGAAVLLGDRGPRHDGRLTLVPSAHLDVVGTLSAVVFAMGWTRPVAVDPAALRFGRAGPALIVLAGTIALVATALAFLALVRPALEALSYTSGIAVAAALRVGAELSLWMAVLNLLPVPPLTGAHLLSALGLRVPKRAVLVSTAALLLLIASGAMRAGLTPLHDLVAPAVLGAAMIRGRP